MSNLRFGSGSPVGAVSPARAGPVTAAGTICWRTGSAGLELLVVHSARWGDWSWPKGKPRGTESAPECAVREVLEETGVRPRLGVPLPEVRYQLPDGQDKVVRYWASYARDTGPRTALADEIAQIAWLPAADALDRLNRPGDRAPAEKLLQLAAAGRLDTRPLIVVRHAKARGRGRWDGSETERPLTSTGRHQARALAGLLACWEPERIVSSPWERCRQTLQPYLENRPRGGRSPELRSALSEHGWLEHPAAVESLVRELVTGPQGALLCTHRPVLAAVIATLDPATPGPLRELLPERDPWLAPAEILIAQIAVSEPAAGVTERVQSIETYRGEHRRNSTR